MNSWACLLGCRSPLAPGFGVFTGLDLCERLGVLVRGPIQPGAPRRVSDDSSAPVRCIPYCPSEEPPYLLAGKPLVPLRDRRGRGVGGGPAPAPGGGAPVRCIPYCPSEEPPYLLAGKPLVPLRDRRVRGLGLDLAQAQGEVVRFS